MKKAVLFINKANTYNFIKKDTTNMIYTGYILGGNKDIKDYYLEFY